MKKIQLSILALMAFALFTLSAQAADIQVTDDGSGTGTVTWTNDNVYILNGLVFVNSGQTLTIEAGTVIKGTPGTGAEASALVVARGGFINAAGTADDPIIFTFEADPLDQSVPYGTRGQWGGLIVLGDAQLNSTPGETQIEGIPDTEPRGLYGGDNDEDNSGTLTYISIRHGGTDIGAGNEINGLTLGGVGSETTIDYVEVVSNADDGIELFGGTAQVKHAVTAFCGDDTFDYDEGWRGKGQFWFSLHDDSDGGTGDRGGEHDGGTDPEDGAPYAHPVIYNSTFMGRGVDAGRRAITFRDNAAGEYHNSIFYNWGRGIDIENLASGEDSYQRFVDGDLQLAGNCFYNVTDEGNGVAASDIFKISMGSGWATEADSIAAVEASTAAFVASFDTNNNEVADPGLFYSISEGSFGLNAQPTNDVSGATASADSWFDAVTYKGAFNPAGDCSWLLGWTFLDRRGFIGCSTSVDELAQNEFELSIYPNPNNGEFTFVSESNISNAQLQIFNGAGQLVLVENGITLTKGQAINRSERLTAGVYYVMLSNGQKLSSATFIVK